MVKRAVDQLVAALDAGESDRLKAYLAMMGRFHHYSWGNVLLIHMQCPQASRVAGYRTWQKLGRQVRRGARAIQILAPIVCRVTERDKDDERVVAFRTAHVFDVSQTEGRLLPEFARVAGDPGRHLLRLKQFVEENGVTLSYADVLGGADGISAGGAIILRTGLEAGEEFSVLAHEAAHELLHRDRDTGAQSKTVKETEAEAVAFVVCQAVGLDTNSAAADYIQLYRGNKDTLLGSLERIQTTATAMIHAILQPDALVPGQPSGQSDRASSPAVKRLVA